MYVLWRFSEKLMWASFTNFFCSFHFVTVINSAVRFDRPSGATAKSLSDPGDKLMGQIWIYSQLLQNAEVIQMLAFARWCFISPKSSFCSCGNKLERWWLWCLTFNPFLALTLILITFSQTSTFFWIRGCQNFQLSPRDQFKSCSAALWFYVPAIWFHFGSMTVMAHSMQSVMICVLPLMCYI